MKQILPCPKCGTPLTFRRWSDRKPVKSEALAFCTQCQEKWQVRHWNGIFSDPYQVAPKAKKTRRGSWRLPEDRTLAIIEAYGSVQNLLDTFPLPCMSE